MKVQMIACAAMLSIVAIPALALRGQANQQAAQQQAHQPHPKTQAEVAALQKVQAAYGAQNWDATIQAINDVLENFPDTEFKPQLLDMAAGAAESKNDYAGTVTYAERAVAADPQDTSMLALLAEDIAQHTHDTDLDKDQSIKKIQDYANKGLDLLKNPATPPPPGLPAASWPEARKTYMEQCYDALAQAASLQKNYPQAIDSYKTALTYTPNPVTMARLAKAYLDNKQYDNAISEANQVLAMSNVPAPVTQFAAAQKVAAEKAKGAAAPAAPTPAK